LTPDQRFTSTPYALQAEEAKTADDADLLDGQDSSAFQQRVSGTCAVGSSIREIASNGTVTCEADDGIVYTAGNQLSLNGTQFNVIEGSGSGLDADLLDGLQGSAYQQRVSGTCAVGSAIRAIASDGTVTCEPHDERPVHDVGWRDAAGDVGLYSSIAIGVDGLPIISYYQVDDTSLQVAHCNDLDCTSATISAVIGTGSSDKGKYSSIAIGSDGLAVIAYYDDTGDDLEVAHCSYVECTSSTTLNVITSSNVGRYLSITIGIDGFPLISFYDVAVGQFGIVHCENHTCSEKSRNNIDNSSTAVGLYTSITIGTDGYGIASYYDSSNGDLKVVHCTNIACSSWDTPVTIESYGDVGQHTSITIRNNGPPQISYIYAHTDGNERLRLARCSNVACSSSSAIHIAYTGPRNAAKRTSITIGSDGFPFIAYTDTGNGHLNVVHCNDATCSSVSNRILDWSSDSTGWYPSATIGMDGMPIISFYIGGSDDNLKIAHCSNVFCIPHWRR
jgi:hypothetical protein